MFVTNKLNTAMFVTLVFILLIYMSNGETPRSIDKQVLQQINHSNKSDYLLKERNIAF